MTITVLYLTEFQVQKLKCVGGENGISPYQITPVPGAVLGVIGQVMEPEEPTLPENVISLRQRFQSAPRKLFMR